MSLPHIILGLLTVVGPKSGYDLKQIINHSTRHFWYCDLSQIYRALDTLKENQWVSGTEDEEASRHRITYTCTPAGEAELRRWLVEAFEVTKIRAPELARVFFGKYIPHERLKEQVINYRTHYAGLLENYSRIKSVIESERSAHPDDVDYWLLTLDLGKRCAQAYLDWCNHVLGKLDSMGKKE